MGSMNRRDEKLGDVLCYTVTPERKKAVQFIGAYVPVCERGLEKRTIMTVVTGGGIPFQRMCLWRFSPFGLPMKRSERRS